MKWWSKYGFWTPVVISAGLQLPCRNWMAAALSVVWAAAGHINGRVARRLEEIEEREG